MMFVFVDEEGIKDSVRILADVVASAFATLGFLSGDATGVRTNLLSGFPNETRQKRRDHHDSIVLYTVMAGRGNHKSFQA